MSSHLPPYHVISTDSQPTQSSLNFFVSAIDRLGILPVNKRRNLGESSILLEGKAEGEEEGREADLNLSSLNNERKSKEKEVTVPIGVVVDSVITGESSENSKNNKAIVTKERKSGRKRKVVEREEDATDKPESLKDAERKSSRIKSIKKRKKVDTKNGDPISSKGPHTEKQAGGKKNAKERPSKKDNRGGKGKDPLMVPTQSNNVDRVNAVVFKSKITGETYLMPPSTASYKPQRNPFISWCFKTGKWVDSRKNKYPCSSHNWSSVLQDEMIDFCAVVVLEDKEISMIERMLGGKRAEGYSAYKHLSETCNVEDSLLRAYVNLGKEIDGHPFGTKDDTAMTKMNIEQDQDGQVRNQVQEIKGVRRSNEFGLRRR
uniref:Uncharacterized protein n=1 Tax=Triparma pacifica TaxID=91992 RepID=A0A7S2QVR7_9STRA